MRRLLMFIPVMLAAGCAEGPAAPGGDLFVAVSAGDGFTCALTREARALCWGAGVFGQLGNGVPAANFSPTEVSGNHRFTAITAGDSHACGLDEAGAAWCWGLNDFFELGSATSFCNQNFRFINCARDPIPVGGGRTFRSIGAAGYVTCGLGTDSLAFCWGWNTHGQLGIGTIDDELADPAAVVGGRKLVRLTVDQFHVCGVDRVGALWCWGRNDDGQLGVASNDDCTVSVQNPVTCSWVPVASAPGQLFTDASAGSTHTCGITTTAQTLCWGSNRYGVIGNPTSAGGLAPVAVSGSAVFDQVSAGYDHVCGRATDGAVWCWGLNSYGQLGSPDQSEFCLARGTPVPCRTSPQLVPGGLSFAQISAGTEHTCGVTRGGAVYCWGRGTEGQLGTGSPVSVPLPSPVVLPAAVED